MLEYAKKWQIDLGMFKVIGGDQTSVNSGHNVSDSSFRTLTLVSSLNSCIHVI